MGKTAARGYHFVPQRVGTGSDGGTPYDKQASFLVRSFPFPALSSSKLNHLSVIHEIFAHNFLCIDLAGSWILNPESGCNFESCKMFLWHKIKVVFAWVSLFLSLALK